jgi:hypothetical protein
MKKLLIILCFLPLFSYGQTMPDTCFTEEQILDISFTIDSLYEVCDINDQIIEEQKQLISDQKTLINLDSLQINYLTMQTKLLKTNIDLYVEREKRLQPRWYDNKAIWFSGGILSTILIFQVAK